MICSETLIFSQDNLECPNQINIKKRVKADQYNWQLLKYLEPLWQVDLRTNHSVWLAETIN